MKKAFIISRMEEPEIDALFEFRKKNFPENRKQMDRARWRWLYQTNPETGGYLPVWLIKSGERIVGSIAAVPTRIKVGNGSCLGSFGTDYFVDPDYWGLPALRLLKTMLAESPLQIGANLSASAKRLFARLGYQDLSTSLFRVSACIASGKPGTKLPAQLKDLSRKAIRKAACPVSFSYEVTPKLPHSYERFWQDIVASLDVSVIKDARYMKWRYEQCPSVDHRFILLSRDGQLRSLAVVAIVPLRQTGGGKHGIILELLARRGDTFAICGGINASLEYFAGHGCDLCDSHLSGSWTSHCFSWMGFRRSPSELGLMVLTPGGNNDLHKTKDPRSWAFALGDTDRY